MGKMYKLHNKLLMNPFFYFFIVWFLLLFINYLNISTIYPLLPLPYLILFIIILFIDLIFMFTFEKRYLKHYQYARFIHSKPSFELLSAIIIFFVVEIIYSKGMPIIEVFRGNPSSYQNFGISFFTPLAVSLTLYLGALSSAKFFYCKKNKFKNLLCVLCVFLSFILRYSRGILIFSFLIFLIVGFTRHKFKLSHLLLLLCLIFIFVIGFNALGNIRQNAAWNDSTYIMSLVKFNRDYSYLSFASWTLVYTSSPIGNLAYNFVHVSPSYSLTGLLSQLLPDFLSKRIFPEYSSSLFLIQPGLTASSMFAGAYKYGGTLGVILAFLELAFFVFLCAEISKNRGVYFVSILSALSMMTTLTFFDNMLTYSGYSFFIVIMVFVSGFYSKSKKIYYKNIAMKLLQSVG